MTATTVNHRQDTIRTERGASGSEQGLEMQPNKPQQRMHSSHSAESLAKGLRRASGIVATAADRYPSCLIGGLLGLVEGPV